MVFSVREGGSERQVLMLLRGTLEATDEPVNEKVIYVNLAAVAFGGRGTIG
jgi:hypothetical protein